MTALRFVLGDQLTRSVSSLADAAARPPTAFYRDILARKEPLPKGNQRLVMPCLTMGEDGWRRQEGISERIAAIRMEARRLRKTGFSQPFSQEQRQKCLFCRSFRAQSGV